MSLCQHIISLLRKVLPTSLRNGDFDYIYCIYVNDVSRLLKWLPWPLTAQLSSNFQATSLPCSVGNAGCSRPVQGSIKQFIMNSFADCLCVSWLTLLHLCLMVYGAGWNDYHACFNTIVTTQSSSNFRLTTVKFLFSTLPQFSILGKGTLKPVTDRHGNVARTYRRTLHVFKMTTLSTPTAYSRPTTAFLGCMWRLHLL